MIDKIRQKIREFLQIDADSMIEMVTDEEMKKALNEARPEISKMCKEKVQQAIKTMSESKDTFDDERLKRLLNNACAEGLEYYEDEIGEAYASAVIKGIRNGNVKVG